MTKEELQKVVSDYVAEHNPDFSDGDDITRVFDEVNQHSLDISFDGMINVADVLSGSFGISVSYWSNALLKRIMIDTDDHYTFENAEAFVTQVMEWEAEAKALEARLKTLK